MIEHLKRWATLDLSPADRAILDQMEEEHETLPARHNGEPAILHVGGDPAVIQDVEMDHERSD